MTEKALRYMGQLWTDEPEHEPSGYTLSQGSWVADREGGRLPVGLPRAVLTSTLVWELWGRCVVRD